MFKSTDPDKPYFHSYVFLFFTPISTSKKMFLSERELKKALSSAVWTLVIFDWFVLSMRMQVILDSLFTHPGSAPIRGGKKGEFRDWTNQTRIPASVNSKLFNLLIPFSFFWSHLFHLLCLFPQRPLYILWYLHVTRGLPSYRERLQRRAFRWHIVWWSSCFAKSWLTTRMLWAVHAPMASLALS